MKIPESLPKRILPGLAFGLILAGALIWNPWSFGTFMLTAIAVCTFEFMRITQVLRDDEDKFRASYSILVTASSWFCFIVVFLVEGAWVKSTFLSLTVLPVMIIIASEIFSHSKHPIQNIGLNLMALLYIGFPFVVSNSVVWQDGKFSGKVLVGSLVCVMMNDVGAYMVGSMIGRTKLISRISPKKTVEGTIGGLFVSCFVAYLMFLALRTIPLLDWIIFGVIASVSGLLGDLVESLIKRSLQLKDTGDVIPGHGGFLDRFDSIIFSLPLFAVYTVLRF